MARATTAQRPRSDDSISTGPQGGAPQTRNEVVHYAEPRLPWSPRLEEKYGVDQGKWQVLVGAIFPAAKTAGSIALALEYCAARKLDIMKRPVHIVPMYDSKTRRYVETIWPGISEIRTTASRTNGYAGCDETEFGPEIKQTFKGRIKKWFTNDDGSRSERWSDEAVEVVFPEWARLTVYRIIGGQRCKFVGPKVYWLETYATVANTELPNEMWQTRSVGQLEKCAEAASLRRAFPEEVGGDLAAEEMEGRALDLHANAIVVDEGPKDSGPPTPAKAVQEPQESGSAAPRQDSGPPAASSPAPTAAKKAAEPPPADQDDSGPQPDDRAAEPDTATDDDAGMDDADDDMAADEGDLKEPPKPFTLPHSGESTQSWSAKYLDLLRTATTLQATYEWIDKNRTGADLVAKKNAQQALANKKAIEDHMNGIRSRSGTNAAPARDAGPPAAATKAEPKARARGAIVDLPDVEPKDEAPETILRWADALLARIEDIDQLHDTVQHRIEPWRAKMFPPDQDELSGIVRKHEKRLGAD